MTDSARGQLRKAGIRPDKGLGQHFLLDEAVLDLILEVSDVEDDDLIVEVGSGIGVLTRRLAERGARVLAVELDRKLTRILRERLGEQPNVQIIEADILELDPVAAIAHELGVQREDAPPFKVVGNLPYYITSAILKHLLAPEIRPTRLTLMVQREVAERITAQPGHLSLLAMSVQVYGTPRIVRRIPAGAFYPRPKVESALLVIDVFGRALVAAEVSEPFFHTLRAAFGQKRKQLRNSLSQGLHLPKEQVLAALADASIDPARRPQTLSVDDWLRLTRALSVPAHG